MMDGQLLPLAGRGHDARQPRRRLLLDVERTLGVLGILQPRAQRGHRTQVVVGPVELNMRGGSHRANRTVYLCDTVLQACQGGGRRLGQMDHTCRREPAATEHGTYLGLTACQFEHLLHPVGTKQACAT